MAASPRSHTGWWLPALLVVLVLVLLASGVLVGRSHIFGGNATATLTATLTPRPTATAPPSPTPTVPPTDTPLPTPSPTVRTGGISYTLSAIDAMQQGANRGDPSYIYRRDLYRVVRHDLPAYFGFSHGPMTIVSPPPPPHPTPTAETNPQGLPEDAIDFYYQGRKYVAVLEQPVQKGPRGIWIIFTITRLS
jgi:hypothetical protein